VVTAVCRIQIEAVLSLDHRGDSLRHGLKNVSYNKILVPQVPLPGISAEFKFLAFIIESAAD